MQVCFVHHDLFAPLSHSLSRADALATDPVQPNNLYVAVGLYTNSWDGRNGSILVSRDRGNSFRVVPLPFKVGGNMPGRGMGEVRTSCNIYHQL